MSLLTVAGAVQNPEPRSPKVKESLRSSLILTRWVGGIEMKQPPSPHFSLMLLAFFGGHLLPLVLQLLIRDGSEHKWQILRSTFVAFKSGLLH